MENQLNSHNTLIIKDLNLAAYLLASGEVILVRTERQNDRQVLFHFSTKDKAEELISKYWSDTNPLSPRSVFNALRSLKDLIFSGN